MPVCVPVLRWTALSAWFLCVTVSLLLTPGYDTGAVVSARGDPERPAGCRAKLTLHRLHVDPGNPVLLDRVPHQPILQPLVGREEIVVEDARVRQLEQASRERVQ